eukprot:TRINITY_DN63140_c0_g1_i1.p1 TRINITY_DN63140_c0_g1~~TRINITY_DN63140_c0_g1_i1.p1  ORF type:complete len:170 (-),score=45.65 TRINITY_DN63140_c0_g1_i1:79-588(-)
MLRSLVGSEMCIRDRSPPVINAIATRAMSASQFYITDIEVLLSGLRLHLTRESDTEKQEAVRKALRVVLRDTIPTGDASRNSDLCRWVGWLQLKADCTEAIEASGVTGDDLQGDFGRLDVVMRLGVDNAEDAEWVFHCLLYTSDAADEEDSVDLGGRRIIKKKKEEVDN